VCTHIFLRVSVSLYFFFGAKRTEKLYFSSSYSRNLPLLFYLDVDIRAEKINKQVTINLFLYTAYLHEASRNFSHCLTLSLRFILDIIVDCENCFFAVVAAAA
jgi:hypothetical protein